MQANTMMKVLETNYEKKNFKKIWSAPNIFDFGSFQLSDA